MPRALVDAPRPLRPNEGLRTIYQERLERAVDEMHKSILYWTRAAYRANPTALALDASPAVELRKAMRKLARRWQRNFDKLAPNLADYFTKAAADRTAAQLKSLLRDAGISVRFKMTAAQREAYAAVRAENVGLIKSIAANHLAKVEGSVMRSVQTGRDLATLTRDLVDDYGVTKRKAAFIARDQNNKATAVFERVRQIELGLQARWLHSAGGKTPRPEHVAASGKIYDPAKGMFLEGVWTWPGVEINCRCVSTSVIPGFED